MNGVNERSSLAEQKWVNLFDRHRTPELEATIREQASALGVPLEEAALASLQAGLASNDESPILPIDTWMAAFNSMVATTLHGNVNADFDRESIYKGLGE